MTAPVPPRRAGLTWPRLPAAAELATIGAGYAAYSLVRLAIRASRQAAFAHAAQLWQAERRLHLTGEPYLNHLATIHSVLAEAAGYYYGGYARTGRGPAAVAERDRKRWPAEFLLADSAPLATTRALRGRTRRSSDSVPPESRHVIDLDSASGFAICRLPVITFGR